MARPSRSRQPSRERRVGRLAARAGGHPDRGRPDGRRRARGRLVAQQYLSPARISAHRRDRQERHAALAIDDAHGDAADRAGGDGSARRPPRAVAQHSRRRRDLRAVRARHRHGRRAATSAEPGGRDARRVAGRHRTAGGAPDTGGVPGVHPEHDGQPGDARTERPGHLRRQARVGARARRRPDRSAGQRHARDRGHSRSHQADRRKSHRHRRRRGVEGAEPRAASRPL